MPKNKEQLFEDFVKFLTQQGYGEGYTRPQNQSVPPDCGFVRFRYPGAALFTLAGVYLWQWVPFTAILLMAGLLQIPTQVYEAAAVDGARWYHRVFWIDLPLLLRVGAIAGILAVVEVIRLFDLVYGSTQGGPGTATLTNAVAIFRIGFENFDTGYHDPGRASVRAGLTRGREHMTSAMLRMRVRLGKGMAWLLALLLAMISVAPILWIVVTSFKTFIQTQAIPPVWPSLTNIDNYVSQFSGSNSALGPLLRSLVVATVTMVITIVVAVPAAYSLARYRIVRKQDVQFWIISSRMMPLIAGVIPLAALLEVVHLYDTVPGLIIVYVGVNLSFAVWLLSIFFQNVPLEVEQAAHIDGLSRFGVLWHISIPLARASIFVVAIFTWIFSWNELLDALVLTSGATETLPVFLSKFASNTLTAYQQMAAVATVQILPAVIITFFAQRYIVAGLSMGALSGE